MTLEELLNVVNPNTLVNIVDADTGELYVIGEGDELDIYQFIEHGLEDLLYCQVMDINVDRCDSNHPLTICIDTEEEE